MELKKQLAAKVLNYLSLEIERKIWSVSIAVKVRKGETTFPLFLSLRKRILSLLNRRVEASFSFLFFEV